MENASSFGQYAGNCGGMMGARWWIGVDLDGTLAHYNHLDWDPNSIGQPVELMVERVRKYLSEDITVKIFTARVSQKSGIELEETIKMIQDWTEEHIGKRLDVTCQKDYDMMLLFDDRAVQVIQNTGLTTSQFMRDE